MLNKYTIRLKVNQLKTDKGAEIDLNLAPKFREWKLADTISGETQQRKQTQCSLVVIQY
jgi:hypothetical protein